MEPRPPERVYVGLGSNLGDRRANLDAAIARLKGLAETSVVAQARVVETAALLPPDDPTPQPAYLNTVVALETTLEPPALHAELQRIERELGRVAARRWAPRLIDLDLALWGERLVALPGLTIPHPELHRRRFVLEPLAEIAPEARHPVLNKTARELLESSSP